MFNETALYKDLQTLGICSTDTVMIHSSYKSVGGYEGGPEGFLLSLCRYFENGLLVLPTHTWAFIDELPVFDKKKDKTCLGLLPDTFLTLPGVYRSANPTHSVAAYGKGAERFVSGEEYPKTPCPRDGCHGKLLDMDGKILFLGCSPKHNTFIHGVEEWYNVPGRLEEIPTEITVKDGETRKVYMHRHAQSAGEACENYDRIVPLLFSENKAKSGKICDSDSIIMRCCDIYELCGRLFSGNIEYFTE